MQARAEHPAALREIAPRDGQRVAILLEKHVAAEIVAVAGIVAHAFMFEAHFADLDVAAGILPRQTDHRADGILRILPPPGERLVDEPIGKRRAGSLIGELMTGGMLEGREIAREAGEGGSEIRRAQKQKAQGANAV